MARKISNFLLASYITIAGAVNALKKDERGLSGVVVAVLLILVAVLAVIIIWGSLSGWIGDLWARITEESGRIN